MLLKQIVLPILIILISFSSSYGQNSEDSIIEVFSACTIYLEGDSFQKEMIGGKEYERYLKDASGKFHPNLKRSFGSGFLITRNELAYIITAEHVAKNLDTNAIIVYPDENNVPKIISLSDISKGRPWTYHPHADVAVLLIEPNSPLFINGMFRPLPESFLEKKLNAPSRQREVTCIGFPLQLGLGKYFSPISIRGKTASGLIDIPRADTKKTSSFFLLDAPSTSGISGGAAFTFPIYYGGAMNIMRTDSITLHGLVHGVIGDESGGKFAAIVPSKFIIETINLVPKYNGTQRVFYPDGRIWSERVFKDGLIWDVMFNNDKNGKPQDKGTLENGNGKLYIYDLNSKRILTLTLKDGIVINEKKE